MDSARYVDVMGQIPFSRTYIPLCFCFPLEVDQQDKIVDELHAAARKLVQDIPYFGGQVVLEGVKEGCSGTYIIKPLEETEKNTFVVVKHVPDLHYETIIKSRGPFSKFSSQAVCPRQGIPLPYPEDFGPNSVFIVQANFISGGVILTFAASHNVVDMNGFAKAITYFSKAMNGEELTTEELTEALRDRRTVTPGLEDGEKALDLSQWINPPDAPPPAMVDARWTTWHFPAKALAQMKAKANAEGDFTGDVPYITTNDMLVAFIWKTFTTLRADKFSPNEQAKFARTIDLRKLAKPAISPYYLGQMVGASYTRATASDIINGPLWKAATLIRRDTNAVDDNYVRSLLSLFRDMPDLNAINPMVTMDLEKDVIITSWCSHPLQSLQFGSLGATTLLRIPTPIPLPSLGILLPHTREGDIDMCMALDEPTIEKLKGDKEWMSTCEYVG